MDAATLAQANANASRRFRISGPRQSIAYIGDSITRFGEPLSPTYTDDYRARGYWVWAQILTGWRLLFLGSFGVDGQTLAQIVARLGDVLALRPGFVVIEGGTNSVNTSATSASIIADWTTAIRQCLAVGAVPVIINIPPRLGNTDPQDLVLSQANAWLLENGSALGAIVVDAYSTVVDAGETPGGWAPNLSLDHIHPSAAGAARIGWALTQALLPYIVAPTPCLPTADPRNLLDVGFGQTDANTTAGREDGWQYQTVAGSAPTYTMIRCTDNGLKWQEIEVPAGANAAQVFRQVTTAAGGFAPGDTLQWMAEFEADADWSTDPTVLNQFGAELLCYNASDALIATGYAHGPRYEESCGFNPTSGVVLTPPMEVPVGTTYVLAVLRKAGGGTIRYRKPTLIKVA